MDLKKICGNLLICGKKNLAISIKNNSWIRAIRGVKNIATD